MSSAAALPLQGCTSHGPGGPWVLSPELDHHPLRFLQNWGDVAARSIGLDDGIKLLDVLRVRRIKRAMAFCKNRQKAFGPMHPRRQSSGCQAKMSSPVPAQSIPTNIMLRARGHRIRGEVLDAGVQAKVLLRAEGSTCFSGANMSTFWGFRPALVEFVPIPSLLSDTTGTVSYQRFPAERQQLASTRH